MQAQIQDFSQSKKLCLLISIASPASFWFSEHDLSHTDVENYFPCSFIVFIVFNLRTPLKRPINNLLTSSVRSLQGNLRPPPWCINLSLRFPCNALCAHPQSVKVVCIAIGCALGSPVLWTSKIKGAQHVIILYKKKKTETSLSRPRAKVKYQGPLGCASYLKRSPVYDTDSFNFD